MSGDLRVTIAYAAPGVEALVDVTLPEGASVDDAMAASGILERLQLDARTVTCAIHGQRAQGNTPLRNGDRIELTRPLPTDPKTARVRRAHAHPLSHVQPRRKARGTR